MNPTVRLSGHVLALFAALVLVISTMRVEARPDSWKREGWAQTGFLQVGHRLQGSPLRRATEGRHPVNRQSAVHGGFEGRAPEPHGTGHRT